MQLLRVVFQLLQYVKEERGEHHHNYERSLVVQDREQHETSLVDALNGNVAQLVNSGKYVKFRVRPSNVVNFKGLVFWVVLVEGVFESLLDYEEIVEHVSGTNDDYYKTKSHNDVHKVPVEPTLGICTAVGDDLED